MFTVNSIYHGFKLMEERKVIEINSIARVFQHVKSGARLLHLENDDDNKMFSISFRTTPNDNTGVAHILEHAVLCGSRKFRSKDIFNDVAKYSLNTFMNAMTFLDKTVYPISSRNHKDFFNLMDVYLDAVFYPNIYENYELLRQEGWRYEIDECTNKLIYKGIVYSEMQGKFSMPESILYNKCIGSLFPNTTYQFISSGDPNEIPSLKQEEFQKFHGNFYHPSNSYIYLYGDQDLNKCLKFINDEYLKKFKRIKVPSRIGSAKAFDEMAINIEEYSISEDEDEENKTYMALSFVCGESKDGEAYLAMKILDRMLIKSDASPLKKALLDSGISLKSNFGMCITKYTVFSLAASNMNIEEKDKFVEVVINVLKSIVKDGIDKELIYAIINSIKFDLREADPWKIANKGIGHFIPVMDSWLYDGNPLTHLFYEQTLNNIKRKVENNYFEKLIEDKLINNKHCSLVILKPKKGLAKMRAKELEVKLQKYKETLSENEILELNERNSKLKANQIRQNTKEELSTLPKLSVDEIPKKIETTIQKVIDKEGIKILYNKVNANKISYVSFLFDANTVEEKYIPYLGLLEYILGKVDTVDKSYSKINQYMLSKTCGITFKTEVYNNIKNNKYYSKFVVKSKTVSENIGILFNLISEIMSLSKFNDKKRIKELIQQYKNLLKTRVINDGGAIGSIRAIAGFSKTGKYKELVKGASFYEFICYLEKNYEDKFYEIQESISRVYKTIFNKNNLIVSYTGDEEYLEHIIANVDNMLKRLNDEKLKSIDISFNKERNTEAIITSSNVQYVVKAFNLKEIGYENSGKIRVLQTILSSEYFYPKIRLQGGAYGCSMSLSNDGTVSIISYRDPNLIETIQAYDKANIFLENISYSTNEMENFIIGTFGKRYRPLTPEINGQQAVRNYICGITIEDFQRERNELLSTSLEDIKMFSKMIKRGMEENYCCVVGNKMKINEDENIFTKVTVLV